MPRDQWRALEAALRAEEARGRSAADAVRSGDRAAAARSIACRRLPRRPRWLRDHLPIPVPLWRRGGRQLGLCASVCLCRHPCCWGPRVQQHVYDVLAQAAAVAQRVRVQRVELWHDACAVAVGAAARRDCVRGVRPAVLAEACVQRVEDVRCLLDEGGGSCRGVQGRRRGRRSRCCARRRRGHRGRARAAAACAAGHAAAACMAPQHRASGRRRRGCSREVTRRPCGHRGYCFPRRRRRDFVSCLERREGRRGSGRGSSGGTRAHGCGARRTALCAAAPPEQQTLPLLQPLLLQLQRVRVRQDVRRGAAVDVFPRGDPRKGGGCFSGHCRQRMRQRGSRVGGSSLRRRRWRGQRARV